MEEIGKNYEDKMQKNHSSMFHSFLMGTTDGLYGWERNREQ